MDRLGIGWISLTMLKPTAEVITRLVWLLYLSLNPSDDDVGATRSIEAIGTG